MAMTYNQIITDLRNKIYYPVYFLFGEEAYFIDEISNLLEESVLSETEKEFNQTIVYGKETDPLTIISYAKRFPMMSNYQVVIIKEAQDVKNIEQLLPYAEKPLKSTLLVVCYKYKKIDRRTLLARVIDKNGVLFESKKLYDNKVPEWIRNYVTEKGYRITPKASVLLAEYLGNDLSRITNETGKLFINISPDTEIDGDHIEQNIGISKDFNIFELQRALGSKDIYKANQIANYFAANEKENPLIKTIAILNSFFTKVLMYHQLADKSRNSVASALSVHPYFITDYQVAAKNYSFNRITRIITYLREYDLRSKGVNNATTEEGQLLKELVFKILN